MYQSQGSSRDRIQPVRRQQETATLYVQRILVRRATLKRAIDPDQCRGPSLDNLGHLTPGFGLLLGQRHPGGLVLGQRLGWQASWGGRSVAGKPRHPWNGLLWGGSRGKGRGGRRGALGLRRVGDGWWARARGGFLGNGDRSWQESLR